jgi:hypothetical protein
VLFGACISYLRYVEDFDSQRAPSCLVSFQSCLKLEARLGPGSSYQWERGVVLRLVRSGEMGLQRLVGTTALLLLKPLHDRNRMMGHVYVCQ